MAETSVKETDQQEVHALTQELSAAIREALENNKKQQFRELIQPLHPADLADALEDLPAELRPAFIKWLGRRFDGELLAYLDETVRESIYEHVEQDDFAKAIVELESDDAVELLENLEDEHREEILSSIPAKERALIEESLAYPDESAGRLMQHEIVTIPAHWTVGETIDFMRDENNVLPTDFYEIFVVDPRRCVLGKIPVSRVLREKRGRLITEIMNTNFKSIPVETDQEDVAHLFRQYGLVDVPVIDGGGRLLGMITFDDVVDVIDEEAEEDLMLLSGVGSSDLYDAVVSTTRSRFWWLAVNLFTAVVASLVIAQFSGTIEKIVALAILMPIVASMAGNSGTQSLTVAVRALAMRELSSTNARRVLWKEVLVGTLNGLLFALCTACIAYFWFTDIRISLIIAVATILSLIVANLSGALIPLGLDRMKIDPAIASGVFLTTVTDVIAFLSFLGLATAFLL